MINEENIEERIEQYLEGNLTQEQKQEFEVKMDTDATFRREVALQKKIVNNVQLVGREQLRAQLKTIHQEMLAESSHTMNYYAIAAVVTLLITAGVVWELVYRPPDEPPLAFLPIQTIDRTGNTRGFAGGMQTVVIYPPNDSLNFHYHLTDTLKLYGPFDVEEIKLYYNLDTEQYLLESDQKRYVLRKNSSVMRIEEV